MSDEKNVPNIEEAMEGDFVKPGASIAEWVDWLFGGVEVTPTDIVRGFIFASIPCKICGKEGKEQKDGAEKIAYVFMNKSLNQPTERNRGIRFFCLEHAEQIDEEIKSRGVEIKTEEEYQAFMAEMNVEVATEDTGQSEVQESEEKVVTDTEQV